MKLLRINILIFTACILLLGCQTASSENHGNNEKIQDENKKKSEENKMSQKEILDFKNIGKAPEATERKPIKNIIKVFFDESAIDEPYEAIAIDIKNNEIYANPIINRSGLRARDGIVPINDADQVLEILEKYNVQSWEKDYSFEDPKSYEDGYSWRLWLQYEDGTVEKHAGKGTEKEKLTPENFDDFTEELRQFLNERLKITN